MIRIGRKDGGTNRPPLIASSDVSRMPKSENASHSRLADTARHVTRTSNHLSEDYSSPPRHPRPERKGYRDSASYKLDLCSPRRPKGNLESTYALWGISYEMVLSVWGTERYDLAEFLKKCLLFKNRTEKLLESDSERETATV